MNRFMWFKLFSLICFIATLVNCTSFGTKLLPKNRQGFAGAMIVSEEQQLLLNLVRIQFEDRPFFVNVDTITTSNTLASDLSSDLSFSSSPNRTLTFADTDELSETFSLNRNFGINPSVSYSDSPTISYSPLQGEAFMRHMLSPISLDDIFLLLASEWSPERVLRVTVEEIFDANNESKLNDTDDECLNRLPQNKKFIELTRLLTYLQDKHMIYFSTSKIDHLKLPPGMTVEDFKNNENYR